MQKQMHNWSKSMSVRESNLRLKSERSRLPIVLPNAVLLKPAGAQTVRENKLFKDEEDFLEIESSLNSTVVTESSLSSTHSEQEEEEEDGEEAKF